MDLKLDLNFRKVYSNFIYHFSALFPKEEIFGSAYHDGKTGQKVSFPFIGGFSVGEARIGKLGDHLIGDSAY